MLWDTEEERNLGPLPQAFRECLVPSARREGGGQRGRPIDSARVQGDFQNSSGATRCEDAAIC